MKAKGFIVDASSFIILDKAGALNVLASNLLLVSSDSIKAEILQKSKEKPWFKKIKWEDAEQSGDKSIEELLIKYNDFALLSDDLKLLQFAESKNRYFTSAIAIPALLFLNEILHKETAIIIFHRIDEIGYYSNSVLKLAWSFFDRNMAPEWF